MGVLFFTSLYLPPFFCYDLSYTNLFHASTFQLNRTTAFRSHTLHSPAQFSATSGGSDLGVIIFDATSLFRQLKSVELNHEMQMTAINPVMISRRRFSKCWSGLLNEFGNWLSAKRLSMSYSFLFLLHSNRYCVRGSVAFNIHSRAFSYHDNYLLQTAYYCVCAHVFFFIFYFYLHTELHVKIRT